MARRNANDRVSETVAAGLTPPAATREAGGPPSPASPNCAGASALAPLSPYDKPIIVRDSRQRVQWESLWPWLESKRRRGYSINALAVHIGMHPTSLADALRRRQAELQPETDPHRDTTDWKAMLPWLRERLADGWSAADVDRHLGLGKSCTANAIRRYLNDGWPERTMTDAEFVRICRPLYAGQELTPKRRPRPAVDDSIRTMSIAVPQRVGRPLDLHVEA